MPVESARDRAAMLSPDDFGETANDYTLAGGGAPASLTGILDRETVPVLSGGRQGHRRVTTFAVAEDTLPDGAGANDTLTLRGLAYVVGSVEPDGTGMAMLRLERAPA